MKKMPFKPLTDQNVEDTVVFFLANNFYRETTLKMKKN